MQSHSQCAYGHLHIAEASFAANNFARTGASNSGCRRYDEQPFCFERDGLEKVVVDSARGLFGFDRQALKFPPDDEVNEAERRAQPNRALRLNTRPSLLGEACDGRENGPVAEGVASHAIGGV